MTGLGQYSWPLFTQSASLHLTGGLSSCPSYLLIWRQIFLRLPILRSESDSWQQEKPEKISLAQATIAVHGGERPEEQPYGAVVSPVFHSATFSFKSFAEMRRYARGELPEAYFYSRYANPTVAEVERKIAELEGAEACVVTASGSAATFAALVALCEAGDEVIACDSIYGGTVKVLTKVLSRFGSAFPFHPSR